ncbi:hypothetical protein, partial [Selenomonas ruminantium]|uniref:hypothetical protein n=1 Tax=Selenomonas ruminantium TaxID=971 RepID=UPI0026F206E1
LPRRGCWLGRGVFQSHAVCLIFCSAWMRGCALRVFPTGPSRGLPAQRAFQPVLVSVPLYTAAGASCIYLGRLGLDGQASVHEGDRGIDIFGEYNKGS